MNDRADNQPAPSPLIAYPKAAEYDRVLPKNKIYAHTKVSRKLQQQFTNEIAQIRWRYKLSPETIHLPAKKSVREIQVFSIALKDAPSDSVCEDLLRCIDRAIKSPIIYELTADSRVRVVAAYKRPSEADAAKRVVSEYFASGWLPQDAARGPMPVALDLGVLYAELLRRLMPLPAKQGEGIRDHAERLERIRELERAAAKLEKRLAREKQFNRKVEVNHELKAVTAQLDALRLDADSNEA